MKVVRHQAVRPYLGVRLAAIFLLKGLYKFCSREHQRMFSADDSLVELRGGQRRVQRLSPSWPSSIPIELIHVNPKSNFWLP